MAIRRKKKGIQWEYYPWAEYREQLVPIQAALNAYGEQRTGAFSSLGFGRTHNACITATQIMGQPKDAVIEQVARYEQRNWLFRGVQRLFTSIKKKQALVCYMNMQATLTTLQGYDAPPTKGCIEQHTQTLKALCQTRLSRFSRLKKSLRKIHRQLTILHYQAPGEVPVVNPGASVPSPEPAPKHPPAAPKPRPPAANSPQAHPPEKPRPTPVRRQSAPRLHHQPPSVSDVLLTTPEAFYTQGNAKINALMETYPPHVVLSPPQVAQLEAACETLQQWLKKSYHHLARVYHPDKVEGNDKAEAQQVFVEINQQYEQYLERIKHIVERTGQSPLSQMLAKEQAEFDILCRQFEARWIRRFDAIAQEQAEIRAGHDELREKLGFLNEKNRQFDEKAKRFDEKMAELKAEGSYQEMHERLDKIEALYHARKAAKLDARATYQENSEPNTDHLSPFFQRTGP